MALKFDSIQKATRDSSIVVKTKDGEDELKFVYYPNAYTPKLEKESNDSRSSQFAGDILIAMVVPVLHYIDIVDGDNKALPITEESLAVLPLSMLNDIMTKINDEMNPGKKKSDDSGSSFSA